MEKRRARKGDIIEMRDGKERKERRARIELRGWKECRVGNKRG